MQYFILFIVHLFFIQTMKRFRARTYNAT